jgi:hypothetical protein
MSIGHLRAAIHLRGGKALPRNCGHRPLVGRRTPGEGGGFFFDHFEGRKIQAIVLALVRLARIVFISLYIPRQP